MFWHYLKVTFRNLVKYKLQSLIGILGLTVGILCFLVSGYRFQSFLNYNKNIPNIKNIYQISSSGHNQLKLDFEKLPEIEKRTFTSFSNLMYMERFDYAGQPYYEAERGIEADTSFINFWSLSVLAGDKNVILNTSNSALLFESKAKKITDNPVSLIGKTVFPDFLMSHRIEGEGRDWMNFKITGILKDPPANTIVSFYTDDIILFNPIAFNRPVEYSSIYAQLNKNTQGEHLLEKLKTTGMIKDPEVFPIYESSTRERIKRMDSSVMFFLLVGFLIFLASLFNFLSFYVGRFYNRLRECALRKTTGAGQTQIFSLFLVEIVAGLLLSFLLAFLFVESFSSFLKEWFQKIASGVLHLSVLRNMFLKLAVLCLLIAPVLSFIPALIVNRLSIKSILLHGQVKRYKMHGRHILLILQMAILLVFLSSALVVWLQMDHTKSEIFPNFTKKQKKQIFSYYSRWEMLMGEQDMLVRDILSSTSVEKACYCHEQMITSSNPWKCEIPELGFTAGQVYVGAGFFDFFGGNIIAGKGIDTDTEYYSVVVNPYFVSQSQEGNLIGKTFTEDSDLLRIVGVADQVQLIKYGYSMGFDKKDIGRDTPLFYMALPPDYSYEYYLYVKPVSGREQEARQHVEKCIRKWLPEMFPVTFTSFQDEIDAAFKQEETIASVTTVFFIICLIISILGIYSSVTLNTERRRKEVAIRKINGAGIRDIFLLFARFYILMWSAVCILIFPFIYYFGNQWLENYTMRATLHAGIFIAVYLSILLVILLVITYQILKVARANPAEVVKKDN